MTDTTTRLSLPLIAEAQAQKHVTHNEGLLMLDALVQAAVKDRDLTTPPATPAEGEAWIVAAGATDAWSGQDGAIAVWQNGAWRFFAPAPGWRVWIEDEGLLAVWDGSAWIRASGGVGSLNPADGGMVGVNTAADATNRLAVKSDAVLLSHDDVSGSGSGDVRLTLNKKAYANTASMIFQSGWSGRAELGLAGDNALHVKVSIDGANWREVLTAEYGVSRARLTVGGNLVVNGDVTLNGVVLDTLAVQGGSPRLVISDRGGGQQSDTALQGNPQLGGSTRWGDVGLVTQKYDQNADPPALTGLPVGIGWGLTRRQPYYGDADGNLSDILTSSRARVDAYSVSSLPPADDPGAGTIIYVHDESGGPTLAFSDGTNWRRVQDGAIVS